MARGEGGGRPTKYLPSFVRKAKALAKLGATEREIAEFFDVDEETLRRWKHRYPKFCGALKVGKAPADARVEQSLYRRATGYSFNSEKIFQYEGREVRVPYVEHVPPDTTAAIFWLKNRRRDRWRDFKATEISTPPGRPLEFDAKVKGEPELIGAYYARLGAAAAASGALDSDPDPDPGVGTGG